MAESWLTPSDAALVRYLAGESTSAEAHAIEGWLVAAPEHRLRLEELRLVLHHTASPPADWDPARSWSRIAARLEVPRRPAIVYARPRFGRSRWQRALAAAGIGAVVVIGWQAERQIMEARSGERPAAVALIERRTGRGERASFNLPDGTAVMLGPESWLRYSAATYGRGDRAVELDGDGYFKAVHIAARPFVVHTRLAVIRDLGTRFTVRARAADRQADVAVAEGRVAVRQAAMPASRDSIVLDAGDAAQVMASGRLEIWHGTDVAPYFAWTNGRLLFDRAPLQVVVNELERWYDVDIELGSSGLERRTLTAGFQDKPIGDVLAVIAASLGLTVSGNGRRFVLAAPPQ